MAQHLKIFPVYANQANFNGLAVQYESDDLSTKQTGFY